MGVVASGQRSLTHTRGRVADESARSNCRAGIIDAGPARRGSGTLESGKSRLDFYQSSILVTIIRRWAVGVPHLKSVKIVRGGCVGVMCMRGVGEGEGGRVGERRKRAMVWACTHT